MKSILYRSVRQKKPEFCDAVKKGCWVHLDAPSPEELHEIILECNLDENIIHDVLDPYEVPRIESEDEHIYIFTRMVIGESTSTKTAPILFITGGDQLISIASNPISDLPEFKQLQETVCTTQKTKLLIQLLLLITTKYSKRVLEISRSIRNMATNLETFSNKDIARFVKFEAIFNDFLTTLQPTNMMLSKLLSGSYVRLYEEDKEFVEDLFIETNQLIQSSQSNLKYIVNIREAYSTIISNNLNRTMKFLTAVTFILTVPTMVASFFGMNVPIPFTENPLGFVIIVTGTLVITLGVLFAFYKTDIL